MPPRRDATSSLTLRAAHARRPKSESDELSTYRGTITDRHTRKVDATWNAELGGIHPPSARSGGVVHLAGSYFLRIFYNARLQLEDGSQKVPHADTQLQHRVHAEARASLLKSRSLQSTVFRLRPLAYCRRERSSRLAVAALPCRHDTDLSSELISFSLSYHQMSLALLTTTTISHHRLTFVSARAHFTFTQLRHHQHYSITSRMMRGGESTAWHSTTRRRRDGMGRLGWPEGLPDRCGQYRAYLAGKDQMRASCARLFIWQFWADPARRDFHWVSLPQMYDFLVDSFEEPEEGTQARARVEVLLAWWNQQVFPTHASSAATNKVTAASRAVLLAQRAAMEIDD
ncbi:hypothetical protein B0H16DRAFT_1485484 [Mycena metata]|uniref:Uncharacterized protein n=1 Tax=Mycena metata TaxID=1033252 RepID=A0AAD7DM55_9AGAR|nr:hypothetical protein B0H16DRAFT_1485484 [Mycena metata]